MNVIHLVRGDGSVYDSDRVLGAFSTKEKAQTFLYNYCGADPQEMNLWVIVPMGFDQECEFAGEPTQEKNKEFSIKYNKNYDMWTVLQENMRWSEMFYTEQEAYDAIQKEFPGAIVN